MLNGGRRHTTAEKYRGHLERFARWYAEPPKDPRLAPIGVDPLRPSLADLERFAGIYAHSLGIGPRARRPMVSALRGFFAWHSAQTGASNPAAPLVQPAFGRRIPRAMSLSDAERLLMAPDLATFMGLRDAAMLALLIGAGFRAGGLCGLNESALFWYADEHGLDRLAIRVAEKGDIERVVPVPNEAAMLLRAYLGHEELASIPRQLPSGDAVVFVTVRNRNVPECDYHGEARRMTRRSLLVLLKRHAKLVGVDPRHAHPHALRHLYGSEFAEDDAPILQHQVLMGHADPKSTQVYAHLAQRKLRRLVDQSNPLAKMRAPLLDSLRQIHRATGHAPATHSDPAAVRKPKSGNRDTPR